MTAVSETDIKELFEQLNSKIERLDEKVDEIKISVAKLEAQVNIAALSLSK